MHRRLSQRLQEVRLTFCEKNLFTPDFTSRVFLIYKMRKLYDVTTCKSLGLDIDSEGKVVRQGTLETAEERGRVHVCAVTEGIFERMKKERRQAQQKSLQELEYSGEGQDMEGETADVENKAEPTETLRIVLRAKGYDDYKLRVHPHTEFSKIIKSFRKQRNVDDVKEVVLHFDGEELEPDGLVQDTDIGDTDCIDVHLK